VDSYVWSIRPLQAEGASTIWIVSAAIAGLHSPAPFNGLGRRGNNSAPVRAAGALVSRDALLGPDGGGFDIMMGTVLPYFQLMNAACSVGLMTVATAKTIAHVSDTQLQHLDTALADLPTIRAYVARMQIKTDLTRALLLDTLNALESGRADTMLRVLEIKVAAGEMAIEVTDLAMRVCGGAAFRKEVGVERYFRAARAAQVMAPTTDMFYDFIGKAVCGLSLLA